MPEDQFVTEALAVAQEILTPPLSVRRGAVLLYQVTVNNRLELTVNPKKPVRGKSAFQTDLCVFEEVGEDEKILLPRVVIEFKMGITTHDVITYSAKARKHKQVYPYLRYGILSSKESAIPGRVFVHNEALDFCVAAANLSSDQFRKTLAALLSDEIEASRRLENIAFGRISARIFRTDVVLNIETEDEYEVKRRRGNDRRAGA
ncbi:MAG TPA: hypothetical protein VEX60_18070 [Pyrinomonadaceae bacterium]|nr:hypothetical protein [Pyrinomonadaceae bacterium]